MSDTKTKKQEDITETQEKVLTRYDLKMQRRKEQKKKEELEKRIGAVVGILLLIGLVCLVVSFPIRSWLTVHGTYVVVGGEKVSRVEYDYNYYTVLNSYVNQNSYLLSYFGLNLDGDLSTQMYSDTMSWKDYFDEMAVDNLTSGIAMRREMEAAGFTYDESEEYDVFVEALRRAATEGGVPFNDYIKEYFGPYATLSRVEEYIRENLKISAFFEKVSEGKTPSDSEIQAYYEENKNSYDLVDYHMLTVEAELPTEPTELADPVDETGDETTAEGEESAYVPSQAEIDAAMELAKAEADELEPTVAAEGEVYTGMSQSNVNYNLTSWLFDSARAKGDTTVIEDSYSHLYYVVSFDDRYINPAVSVNVRAVLTLDGNGQAILDEWLAGDATEDSFAALADRYNDYSVVLSEEGGLLEGLRTSSLSEELSSWLSDESRVYGDTAVITPEYETITYVFYYLGAGDPEWKVAIREILLDDIMGEYVTGLTADMKVEDPHHNLKYLEIRAREEAAAAADTDNSSEDSEAENSSAE